jgi:AraC family transcriptional regulator
MLVGVMMEPTPRSSTLEAYKERMLRVLVHVQRHLDADLRLDDLARLASFSPYHFHRVFRGMLGESVGEHVRRLRLERAAARLKHGDRSVTSIAFEAGYGSHEAFTRAFKAMSGRSPSDFRARNRTLDWLARSPTGVHYREGGEPSDFEPLPPGGESMQVKIESFGPMRVAFVRHVGPYEECKSAWDTLCTKLGREGRLGGDVRFLGMCHDDPEVTPPERIRYDACVTVDDDFEPEGPIGVQTIPAAEYAVTTHFGPYEKLNETYAELFGRWLPRSGRALRALPSLELYWNDPEGTDAEDLVTDICAPLEPK